ncbi:MAG: argininosuccinate synthase [Methanomassiliicoccales archaeon]
MAKESAGKEGTAVLAYSGGLDTSVAIQWIKEKYGTEVIAVTVDVGQQEDLREASQRALENGAAKAYVVDATDEFANEFISSAIKANALYEGKYPLSTALARPLIAAKIAALAVHEGATHIAHGCTGKGNDQVRFELTLRALIPEMRIIAPIREWNMNREEEQIYAREKGIKLRSSVPSRFSTDENLWGRSIEGGELEDPATEPPEEIYAWTGHPETWPSAPEYAEIVFERGIPVELNGEKLPLSELIRRMNQLAGRHGVGRIDHMEDRVVGIKSRENYECPAAISLITAHRALESLVLSKEMLQFKSVVEQRFSELVYTGMWFSELMEALQSFIETSQENVSGYVRVRMQRGTVSVAGISSDHSLYATDLSTYGVGDSFNQKASEGFIYILSLPIAGRMRTALQELSLSNVRETTLERKIQPSG